MSENYPHLEDLQDYALYEEAVARFFASEGINNLSLESAEYPDREARCQVCNEVVDCFPFFSWRACDCCGRNLGGDRYHATGWNDKLGEAFCYEVCQDCIYYAEYGRLDDMTMRNLEIELLVGLCD